MISGVAVTFYLKTLRPKRSCVSHAALDRRSRVERSLWNCHTAICSANERRSDNDATECQLRSPAGSKCLRAISITTIRYYKAWLPSEEMANVAAIDTGVDVALQERPRPRQVAFSVEAARA